MTNDNDRAALRQAVDTWKAQGRDDEQVHGVLNFITSEPFNTWLEGYTSKQEKLVLGDYIGWIQRLHAEPENSLDRWSAAAMEIVSEGKNRIAELSRREKTGGDDE